ncbi:MAG: SRPBCC domain-containing protein [Candidatus Microsaccharimonas sp.]
MDPITVQIVVEAPLEDVWEYWTSPSHITHWAFASDDWEAVDPINNLYVGGTFKTTMQAKDGSQGFDFTGTYTAVEPPFLLAYDLDDGRHVRVEFDEVPEGVQIIQTFDPEDENPPEFQKSGWQAFLENFKKHAES